MVAVVGEQRGEEANGKLVKIGNPQPNNPGLVSGSLSLHES